MLVAEPSLQEIFRVASIANEYAEQNDESIGHCEPITAEEVAIIQKVKDWATALESMTPDEELDLAMAVLKKHGLTVNDLSLAEHGASGVFRILALSTTHLTEVTAYLLFKDSIANVIVYKKEDYGWFIPVPTDLEQLEWSDIPPDLRGVLDYANARDCLWVMFDQDADVLDGLPTWEL